MRKFAALAALLGPVAIAGIFIGSGLPQPFPDAPPANTPAAPSATPASATVPPCATEDYDGPETCFWDAKVRSNGMGHSFIWDGTKVIYTS